MAGLSSNLIDKALKLEFLSVEEGLDLYHSSSLSELTIIADLIRKKLHPDEFVSYIVDRNINLSNLCVSNCLFCNFCRTKKSPDSYILTINDYIQKIDELYSLGGRQILLQGGMHPDLNLDYYVNLFKVLKSHFPDLKLHALGPPEIVFVSNNANISVQKTLEKLISAGLDSLPGAGAEILSDRVRKIVSPVKCTSSEWINVMKVAHKMNLTTSATMMFGHLETLKERVEHLILIRETQAQKPNQSKGFISFTLWPLAGENTRLIKKFPNIKTVTNTEFLKMLAFSRIILPNIKNIQTSWLTMGPEIAQVCLSSGANDMSSIMIEENVVSQAGKNNKLNIESMRKLIEQAGYIPVERNQEYEIL